MNIAKHHFISIPSVLHLYLNTYYSEFCNGFLWILTHVQFQLHVCIVAYILFWSPYMPLLRPVRDE